MMSFPSDRCQTKELWISPLVLTLTERSVGSLKKLQDFLLLVAENATKMDGESVNGIFLNRTS